MEMKTYIMEPDKVILKQGYLVSEPDGDLVYEFKMLKQSLFGAMEFEFINHVSGQSSTHKVSHTVTTETSSLFYDVKSSFKLDGKNIWDYLHEQGIRIDTGLSKQRLGLMYDVSLKGQPMATISTYSPQGEKAIFTTQHVLKIETEQEYLDLAALTAFAVARTEQALLS